MKRKILTAVLLLFAASIVASPQVNTFCASNLACTISGTWTHSAQIISSVATGTAPFSVASTTQVANLNASQLGGLNPPASAIVGISDTQTLTGKTFDTAGAGNVFKINGTQISATTGTGSAVLGTSPALTTPTIDGTTAGHAVLQISAATNFGTALGSQTIIASMPSTTSVSLILMPVVVTAGAGCSAATNSVTVNPVTWTGPGGNAQSINPSSNMGFTGNGVVDNGASTFGSSAFTNNGIQAIVAKTGTAIAYSTTSTLASTGCSPVPQYQIYAKIIF